MEVRNLPTMWMGWNSHFEVTPDPDRFYMKSYALFGVLQIIGATVIKNEDDNTWQLFRDGDPVPMIALEKIGETNILVPKK